MRNSLLRAFFVFLTFASLSAVAQRPQITSIDTNAGSVAETVTINGNNFGTDSTKLAVFFGAVKGRIMSVANQVIEARVPAGTTYDNISVINKTNGLTGYTREQFLLAYGGSHPLPPSTFASQVDFTAERGLYDLCLCDFDGDKRVDVATASDNASSIRILPNTSAGPGNIAFNVSLPLLPIGTRTLHSRCGDLNGDGKPDLALSENGGDRIFIFTNASSGIGNFTFSSQNIRLTGRKTKRIEIADLDLNGKPELIISDQGSNQLTILVNESTTTTIKFNATPVNVTITGASIMDGLAVEDINGDQLPEIVMGQFLSPSSNLFVVSNNSVPGTITLGPVTAVALPETVINIRLGDLDGDNKADIAATLLLQQSVAVLRNTTTGSTPSFEAPKLFAVQDKPYGLDFGDLDGDGKTDIVVASITKNISILDNESTAGNLSFQSSSYPTTFINRHVGIGDLDTDGKPEIIFTSVDDNATGILSSKISVMRNANCVVPEVTPPGPLNVCVGTPLRLLATVSRGTTYEWKNETTNTVITSGAIPYLDVTATAKYSVRAIGEGGTCSKTSNIVDVTFGADPGLPDAVATNTGPACVGNSVTLNVTNVGATQYKWTGPGGYTATGLSATISALGPASVGRYYVDIIAGGCVTQTTSTVVESIDIGNFTVTYPSPNVMCQGDSKTLTLFPTLAGATYQWYQGATSLAGQTASTLTVTTTGDYSARVSYPGCTTTQTDAAHIVAATVPVAAFSMPSDACTGQLVQFTNQSTSDPNAVAEYYWTFGDGGTSTEENPQHTYLTANTFNAKLRVAYTGTVCPNETPTKPITVQAATIPVITTPGNVSVICPGETLVLSVSGTYTSYLWSTGETTPTITITEGDTYTVEVTTAACTLNASKVITEHPVPIVLVTAAPPSIGEGESSQLNAEGLATFLWSPAESLSNSTIKNPVANPTTTTLYTVTGDDTNGCPGEGSVEVSVKGDAIVTKLTPENFFSPDNNGQNESWEVENIGTYPQCGVTIYDEKGVMVYESKPYMNNWDGTIKGKKLPDGVYYYIIRCDGEEDTPKTGSITIIRRL